MKNLIALLMLSIYASSFAAYKNLDKSNINEIKILNVADVPEGDLTITYRQYQKLDKKTKELDKELLNLDMKIYYPNSKKPESPLPAALFFGGGGWNRAHPTQFSIASRVLAEFGMIAIYVDYRTKDKTNIDDPSKCVEDAKTAMRYLREHAKELGVNPNMIAAGGGSAGGHVAAALDCLDTYNDKDDNLKISARPNLLLLYNPVIDNSEKGFGYSRVKDMFPEISPLHNLKKDAAPSIVFVGAEDGVCKASVCKEYKKFLDENNIDCELYIYEGQSHGFFNPWKGEECFNDTLNKLLAFLRKHKYID